MTGGEGKETVGLTGVIAILHLMNGWYGTIQPAAFFTSPLLVL